MDNHDELSELELDLEAIMKEFHDPSKDEPEQETGQEPEDSVLPAEPEEAPEEPSGSMPELSLDEMPQLSPEEMPEAVAADLEEALDSLSPEDTGEEAAPEDTPEEAAPEEPSAAEDALSEDGDAPSDAATVRIDDLAGIEQTLSEETPEPEAEEEEQQEPAPIPFSSRERLHALKKKIIAGPEKQYYTLSEAGVGKLQISILLNLILVILCIGGTALYALHMIPDNRIRFLTFSQIFAMMLSALLGCYLLLDGIGDLFHGRFSMNTLLFFTLLACGADAVFCLKELRVPCCAAFCLEMTMALWARYHRRAAEMSQMDTLRKAVKLRSLVKVPDYYNKRAGILRGEGDVDDFMDTYASPSGPERVQSVYAFISLIVCIGIAVMTYLLHSVSMAVQILSTSLLVAVPASFFVSLTRPGALLERRLHMVGAVICGWQGVRKLCGKAAFPLRDEDLFPSGTTKLNGVKFYGERNPDEIVAYTTSLITTAGGGLVTVFRNLLASRSGETLPVEDFQDYGSGGIGGIIGGEPVLLGSLDFIQDMGVHVPDGTMVNQAVYAAIGGELCAVAAISYARMRLSAAGLVSLCGCRKLTPILLADDFMVTEGFLRSKFSVNTRRMVCPDKQTRAELSSRKADPDADVLALITRDDLASSVYPVTGAMALRTASRLGVAIHIFGGILGMLIMLAVAYLGSTELLTPIRVLLYQLVWAVPGLLVTEWTRTV